LRIAIDRKETAFVYFETMIVVRIFYAWMTLNESVSTVCVVVSVDFCFREIGLSDLGVIVLIIFVVAVMITGVSDDCLLILVNFLNDQNDISDFQNFGIYQSVCSSFTISTNNR
jgi:hypothetical protein